MCVCVCVCVRARAHAHAHACVCGEYYEKIPLHHGLGYLRHGVDSDMIGLYKILH